MFQGIFRATVKFGNLLRCKFSVEFFAEVLENFALFFKRKFFNLLQNLRCTSTESGRPSINIFFMRGPSHDRLKDLDGGKLKQHDGFQAC
jgi:hypothetical protein